jgi:transglutaminase-like putative cysteine protease
MRVVGWVGGRVVRAVWISTMVLVPLFGFWLASSLAAYQNASQWLALLVGLLLFPIVPIGWDLFFVWRRSKRPAKKAILTRLDRLVLRTLIVNGVFLGGMMWMRPHVAFRALAVRGDWVLDGHDGPIANAMRGAILGFADAFEQRWRGGEHVYGPGDAAPKPEPKPPAPPIPHVPPTPDNPTSTRDPKAWPMDAAIDPAVTEMAEDVQTSVDAVGKYLASKITEPRRLVKALHDYVDLRLTYDHHAADLIESKSYADVPPQDADTVFRTHSGVCEGYARLLAALGKSAGVEIAFVTGYARDSQQRTPATEDAAILATLSGYAHAWNAARIDGQWLLIDATWDDSHHDGPISSTYLFTPAELFAYQHLPDQEDWQLLDKKLTPGEFVRQPLLTPIAGELGVKLVEPTRSQVTADGDVTIVVENPRHIKLVADVIVVGAKDHGRRCTDSSTGDRVSFKCSVGSGQFEVQMFGALQPSHEEASGMIVSTFDYFGSLQVNGR